MSIKKIYIYIIIYFISFNTIEIKWIIILKLDIL